MEKFVRSRYFFTFISYLRPFPLACSPVSLYNIPSWLNEVIYITLLKKSTLKKTT